MESSDASWQADPTGRHELRWWDGSAWGDHVSDRGVVSSDPVGPLPPAGAAAPAEKRSKAPLFAVLVLVVVGAVAAAVVFALGGDDALSDDDAEALAEEVIEDVELPGDGFEIDDDGFALDCPLESAGLDDDAVLAIAVVPEATDPEGEVGFLAVSVATFADADDIDAVLDRFAEDDTAECFTESLDDDDADPIELEAADGLEIDDEETASFAFDGDSGFREHFLPVGRFLVDVQVDGGSEGDELAEDVLLDVRDALLEGGA